MQHNQERRSIIRLGTKAKTQVEIFATTILLQLSYLLGPNAVAAQNNDHAAPNWHCVIPTKNPSF